MFEGNIFLEEQGIPILKMDLKRILLAEALPVPFAVAMLILRSLTLAIFSTPEAGNFQASEPHKSNIPLITNTRVRRHHVPVDSARPCRNRRKILFD